MSNVEVKLPYVKALNYANRFLALISNHVIKAEIAGSLRRKCDLIGDIEIVCIENPLNPLNNLFVDDFPGVVINGDKLKRFHYPQYNLKIELYITNERDWGRILALRTGSAWYSHAKLAVTWNRLGWCGTSDGLRRKKECEKRGNVWRLKKEFAENPTLPPPFYTEEDFFEFLGLEWEPPEKRNWKDPTPEKKYSYI